VFDSERQGSSLQLQLEQTALPHPGSGSGGSGRERTGQARQSRGKSQKRVSPYHHQQQSRDHTDQSRDAHLSLQHYTASSYDDRRYYYDESYPSTCMMDCTHDDRLISTACSLVPYNYTLYCSMPVAADDGDYLSAQRSPSPRDQSACAVHSSVIVRRHVTDTDAQRRWPNSCCKVASEQAVRGYGGEDTVGGEYTMVNGGVAGYTSVIVATSGATHVD